MQFDRDRFKPVFNIDKSNHPDSQIVNICGKKVSLGEVRKLYEAFEEKRYNMISFYDDMFQYTSLGLLDLLFELHNINSPIPFKQFFKRKEVYGKEFVYNTVKRFNISKEEVDEVEKTYYEEILTRSPVSHNAPSYFKIREICSAQLLIMKYPISIKTQFIRNLQEAYGKDEFISLNIDYIHNKTEEEYLASIPKANFFYFDTVICQDAASVIEFIVKNDIKDTQILTPLDHCGLSGEAIFTFESLLEGTGPNNSKINYVKEEV